MNHSSDHAASEADELGPLEESRRPVSSLASHFRLRRPMVIVDEARNARTPTSFDTSARFAPSLILELTAKPQTEHKPARDQHAANILHFVSAAELKTEALIEMPIGLTTDRGWRKTIGEACDCRAALEEEANPESREARISIGH